MNYRTNFTLPVPRAGARSLYGVICAFLDALLFPDHSGSVPVLKAEALREHIKMLFQASPRLRHTIVNSTLTATTPGLAIADRRFSGLGSIPDLSDGVPTDTTMPYFTSNRGSERNRA
ncbi:MULTISPECIES: hypothetical protein [unclassified Rhizobium]|uniref:hypothetical protein n=1 Tax=unclassified Rhizobium TaxID=2613769 RepID=UPI0012E3C10F|nr:MULTISPECIES: hypothetical protein [unclassified Rhizobium]